MGVLDLLLIQLFSEFCTLFLCDFAHLWKEDSLCYVRTEPRQTGEASIDAERMHVLVQELFEQELSILDLQLVLLVEPLN